MAPGYWGGCDESLGGKSQKRKEGSKVWDEMYTPED